ncbi:hypothetical protein JIN85_03165 [Luteolibacter pohnpeiensis]|uniref:Uncharacterized protein n=1 Tax=Luteolibacter pohnpeiensis TaxID=454153 RepID=A0A934S591_9BACT|nr:hypothetical protein [Luteolibacter pohnpeiensis]MBK1881399.1 hypothetical protein [Luteolibacter pohnpeiensis]
MKVVKLAILASALFLTGARATTISMVPIFEPLSLHGTDSDDAISEIGEALQATVLCRPMALTGAFPEVLVDSIRSPHKVPTNNPNYTVDEVNLLVLCNVGISGEMTDDGLLVRLDVANLSIPADVDLTSRQVLNLAIVALRKTLEVYQAPQADILKVKVVIMGVDDAKASLKDLDVTFEMPGAP